MKQINNNLLSLFLIVGILLFAGCGESYNDATTDSTDESITSDVTLDDWTEETHSNDADANFDEVFSSTEVKRLDIVITEERWEEMLANMTELYGTFGASSSITEPVQQTGQQGQQQTGQQGQQQIGGQQPQQQIGGQEQSTVTEVFGTTDDPDFKPAEIYYTGSDNIKRQWYKVGVRFKGNSSLSAPWEQGILKLSFKLDFDEFEDEYPEIDNQRFYGFKKLSLKNNYNDTSFLREKVAAEVFEDNNMAVAHTAFYTVYVDHGDGAEYFGLYTLVETVDDTVIDSDVFTNNDGNLYKPENGSASFVEGTFDSDDFEKKTNEDEADWSDIQSLFTALHDTTRTTDAASWREGLEKVFDVDTFLKYLAINGVIQNWDTYGQMLHNYYLYNNDGKLTWILWDNNEAFKSGTGNKTALPLDLSNVEDNSWPLISKIYADTTYKAKYDEYVEEAVSNTGTFYATDMETKYDVYSDLIESNTTNERDGFTFFTTDNYENEFTTSVNELKTHVTERATAVSDYLGN